MKVATIVGTRPELIKLSRVISELDESVNHILIHSGQNYDYELNEIFFKDLKIRKPDFFLNSVGKTTAETIANIIVKTDELLRKEKPDAVLIYGDTNSCLSVISAKRLQIPVFHMEAGNRCFDQRVPEELNRKIVDHLSDINLPLTEQARDYLISEGIKPETVIKTGSCMREILEFYKSEIKNSNILEKSGLEIGKYFVVSAHREENVDYYENLINLIETLNALAEKYNYPIIVSTHPRTKNRLEKVGLEGVNALISFSKPLGFFDYVKLQINSFCVLSDSGTITEESSILGFPAITIRAAHERPEGMDEGTLIMSGIKKENILEAVKIITNQKNKYPDKIRLVKDYEQDNVSIKIVRIILSYTDFINRNVWKKDVIQKSL